MIAQYNIAKSGRLKVSSTASSRLRHSFTSSGRIMVSSTAAATAEKQQQSFHQLVHWVIAQFNIAKSGRLKVSSTASSRSRHSFTLSGWIMVSSTAIISSQQQKIEKDDVKTLIEPS